MCRRRPPAGHFFGFPYSHTGPAGGKGSAYHVYNRDAGIGPNIADPDVNANETKLACNGGRPAEGSTLRRLWRGCGAACAMCYSEGGAAARASNPTASCAPERPQ